MKHTTAHSTVGGCFFLLKQYIFMDNIDGIPIVWDDADKLFGSLFPDGVAQSTQGFAGGLAAGEVAQYDSPFWETQWQNYYMDELIAFMKKTENDSFKYFITNFKETTRHKIQYPKPRQIPGFSNIGESKEFANTIHTYGMIDASVEKYEEYNIYIVTGKDGIALRKYFNMGIVKPNDLVFFLEDNINDISEPVLLCKMGSKWQSKFSHRVVNKKKLKEKFNETNINLKIDATKFNELITKGEIKGYPWLDEVDNAGRVVYYAVFFPNYIVSVAVVNLMELYIEGLEWLKIKETSWLPDADKPDAFVPLLIPSVIIKEIALTKDVIKTVISACIENIKSIDSFIDEMLKSDSIIDPFMQNVIGGFLTKAKVFIQSILLGMPALEEMLIDLIDIGVNTINAFLCGVINGFIDAIIGIVTLVKWVFSVGVSNGEMLSDLKNKLPKALETLDNLAAAWSAFSFGNFYSALKKSFVKFIKTLFNDQGGFDLQMHYKIAYFVGNVVGFIIEFILEIIITAGIGAVAKIFTSLASFGEKIGAKLILLLEKILNLSLKEIGKDIISVLNLMAKFFTLKIEQLVEFFTKFFEELKVIFGIGLKPATEALFEKLGLTWRSLRLPTLNTGVRLGDQLWGVYHKGVVVIKGTKKEIEAFAEKLKGMTEGAAKKYLDDLFEAKRFIKSVYGESELSRLAIEYRKGLPVPKHNGNVAIFEYIDETGKIVRKEFTTYSKKECKALGINKSPHAEILGLEWLEKEKISFDKVKKVYSELEPCSLTESLCKEKITKNCKNALIEHSFEYPGKEAESILTEIRRAAIAEREKILNKIITN